MVPRQGAICIYAAAYTPISGLQSYFGIDLVEIQNENLIDASLIYALFHEVDLNFSEVGG